MHLISPRIPAILCASFLLLVPVAGRAAAEADPVKIDLRRLPGGLRFGLIGDRPAQPAPTLFVLQGDLDVARKEPIYTEVARIMARHGFVSVLLDAPAHGEDRREGEPPQLAGWAARVERGENFVAPFNARASAVLDYLVKECYTDPTRVAACGTSRGGFLAFHFAAAEPRIRFIGGIAALTDLTALKEFATVTNRSQAEALSLRTLVSRLAGRPAWVCIGNNDARIDTDRVIGFTRALVKATAQAQKPEAAVPVEVVINTSAGHRSSLRDHELLAAWLLQQFGLAK